MESQVEAFVVLSAFIVGYMFVKLEEGRVNEL